MARKDSFKESMSEYMENGIKQTLHKMYDAKKEEMLKQIAEDFDTQRDKLIAAMALRITHQLEIVTREDRVTITIRKEGFN